MRLIDADEFVKELEHLYLENGWSERDVHFSLSDTRCNLLMIPTADVAPVKHGKWIYEGVRGRFPACRCSVCGNVENADWAMISGKVNYCPNCGAKMEGEGK